jgi:hypothetical protein
VRAETKAESRRQKAEMVSAEMMISATFEQGNGTRLSAELISAFCFLLSDFIYGY